MKRRKPKPPATRTYAWNVPIYGQTVELVVGGTFDQHSRRLEEMYGETPEPDGSAELPEACTSLRWNKDGHMNIHFWFSNMDPDSIRGVMMVAHETFHATVAIAREVGLQLCDGSEEAFAYLQTDMVKEIMQRLRSKR